MNWCWLGKHDWIMTEGHNPFVIYCRHCKKENHSRLLAMALLGKVMGEFVGRYIDPPEKERSL